jgi:hypothetical protein
MTTVAPAVVLNAQDDLFLWPNYLGTHRTQISCTVSDSLHLEERFRQGHRVANCCATNYYLILRFTAIQLLCNVWQGWQEAHKLSVSGLSGPGTRVIFRSVCSPPACQHWASTGPGSQQNLRCKYPRKPAITNLLFRLSPLVFGPARFASVSRAEANSFFGTVKREQPQSKQTKSFGNTQTPGLSRFLRAEKWMTISAVSCLMPDPHNRQDIRGLHTRIKNAYKLRREREERFVLCHSNGRYMGVKNL